MPGSGAGLDVKATLELTAGDDAATSIAFAAGTMLSGVVEQIDAREDLPVYAAEVNGRLVLSARTTGDGSVFTAAGTLVDSNGIQEHTTLAKTIDLSALYQLDGEATRLRLVVQAVTGGSCFGP